MKTSSFFLYQGPGRISIARFAPKDIPLGYARYSALTPRQEMLKMPYPQYREIYFGKILAGLNPQQVWDDLHRLVDCEPVLLCWERLNIAGAWCHRRMVAEWFEREFGVVVEEMEFWDDRQASLF